MVEAIKMAIKSPECKLEEILKKIDIFFLENKITENERDELIEMARTNAIPENSYNIQKQLDNIFERLEKLEAREPTNPEIPSEEYPEFVQPTGSHDAYKIGDKITFKEKKYICKIDNCVWSPEVYPQGWEEKVEVI